MTIPTLTQLLTPLTTEDVVAASLEVAAAVGLPVTAWQPTSIAREIIWVNSANISTLSTSCAAAAGAGLLDYAAGDWLTLTADQSYAVTRVLSTQATGPVLLTNSTATPQTWAVGALRIQNTSRGGVTYTNSTGGTLAANGTLSLQFAADASGTGSNITTGDALSLVTAVPGVTATRSADLLGADGETDAALRARCRASVAGVTPNGPASAYLYWASSTTRADGTPIGVTRIRVVQGSSTVLVYVADSDGVVASSDVALIQSAINLNCVPTGIVAGVLSAATAPQTIALTVTKSPTTTATQASREALIAAAYASYFSTIPVGGDSALTFNGLYLSTLVQLARDACGASVLDVKITSPTTDVALVTNTVPTVGTLAVTWL